MRPGIGRFHEAIKQYNNKPHFTLRMLSPNAMKEATYDFIMKKMFISNANKTFRPEDISLKKKTDSNVLFSFVLFPPENV